MGLVFDTFCFLRITLSPKFWPKGLLLEGIQCPHHDICPLALKFGHTWAKIGQIWPNLALKSKILKYTCVICHFKGNFKQNTNSLFKIEKNVSKSSGGFRGLLITKFEKFGPELIQYQHLICYSLLSRELNFEFLSVPNASLVSGTAHQACRKS